MFRSRVVSRLDRVDVEIGRVGRDAESNQPWPDLDLQYSREDTQRIGLTKSTVISADSKASVETLTWPSPPFQPCTAMTVASGWTMPSCRATRKPYLRNFSTAINSQRLDPPNPVVHVNLPFVGGDPTRLGVMHGVHSSGQVQLAGCLLITSH